MIKLISDIKRYSIFSAIFLLIFINSCISYRIYNNTNSVLSGEIEVSGVNDASLNKELKPYFKGNRLAPEGLGNNKRNLYKFTIRKNNKTVISKFINSFSYLIKESLDSNANFKLIVSDFSNQKKEIYFYSKDKVTSSFQHKTIFVYNQNKYFINKQ